MEPIPSNFQSLFDHGGERARTMLGGMLAKYPNLAAFVDATSRRRRLLEHLPKLREGKVSQRELAKRMVSHQPTIAALERGLGDPRVSTLERYAASLGLVFFWQMLTPEGTPAVAGYSWDGDRDNLEVELGISAALDSRLIPRNR
jgi:transcriptional regulator with XRE-family HTH domain